MARVAIVGGAGYIGGELLRLLLGHPEAEVAAVTSTRLAGRRVDGAHPNLRGLTDLTFVDPGSLEEYDALFLATPHTETMGRMTGYAKIATTIFDLSADFRLRDPEVFRRYYGLPHEAVDLLPEFVLGLPELHRDRLRAADRVAVPGCMATAGILALRPAAAAGLIEPEVTIDARTGSSGSGATAGPENLHAERSGAMRVFAPTRHRHEAEIGQETGLSVRMSATGVEAVRGVQVLCRARLAPGADERAVRAAYRAAYAAEPFVRVVAQKRGLYRLPEPKILSGSNFCDVGFAADGERALVLVAALDNLVKGGAGNAVQCMNVRYGWPERAGLTFAGLHPN
ncbi:N-acetyl-gamma-glutamyl-phosphate/N-acetyl-gamma- aminoadipyl-phosphate reductase [Sphaerisporangium krabiense]|uniref:N-acetyl-gamma-glutamyl-phosphate reductase n=1 Tax=Sphaerisporangium krabiense TaxID=763782 RepID=A0A7W8Z652_9ACTN|nr:N-acetyl-gamma-glutamyl-phosphate reductase [Sphaerisporangium krabiense]MBB5627975.1 N-acetyl-gamma-glutamyl-phosphate/LysW-gamma-L-alpha-aminoadipyl-6-phosphate reductase [Sphaerisporangium krabiense]GII62139.1 N-acetyl-gamma-glutamyl-phosphate/N-acetyl-gamma- aminoadipyl-phosphate reductase [Sphaerisporangium krabiense]